MIRRPGASLGRSAVAIGLILAMQACSKETPSSSPPAGGAKPGATIVQNDVVSLAKEAIAKHQLTTLRPECLSFETSTEGRGDITVVEVRELHNDRCGGDPAVAPRLFSLRIERSTHSVWTDAKSLNGEFQKLP